MLVLLALIGTSVLFWSVTAQSTTHATCSAGFEWMDNSLSQDPCKVSEYLGGVCNGGVFTVPPLDVGEVYRGPDSSVANQCRCSAVFYAMTSACAACQTRNWMTWSGYNANCTKAYLGFPLNIPSGTTVPHYAYQNFTATDKWDITIAQTDTGPESAAPKPTGTTTGGSSSSGNGNHKTNVGAIAGGVVGGVVLLGLIVAGIVFFVLRRRHRQTPQPRLVNLNEPLTPPPMSYTSPSPFASMQTPKLYDPSDPSTFPSTPASPGSDIYTTHSSPAPLLQPSLAPVSPVSQQPPVQPSAQPYSQPYYHGVPEL